jgi:hypothetical protein
MGITGAKSVANTVISTSTQSIQPKQRGERARQQLTVHVATHMFYLTDTQHFTTISHRYGQDNDAYDQ